ncbi:hypothetical protein [Ornithinibacillus xuwenensis]|jgi:hypothetical protein|uniref:Uncharacterized protein n=1 Tax=Ornithinibacillus xuwenensis TaxID=3144668 RepID=A0ABU9XL27_9BACI
MIKKGYFGIYNGKEYKVVEDNDNNVLIMTDDPAKITDDFVDTYGSGVYTKKISQNELSEFYYIKPQANYKGSQFNVGNRERDGKVCLGTGDAKLAKKLNFERTDKYYYEKWVLKDEVLLMEQRKDIQK